MRVLRSRGAGALRIVEKSPRAARIRRLCLFLGARLPVSSWLMRREPMRRLARRNSRLSSISYHSRSIRRLPVFTRRWASKPLPAYDANSTLHMFQKTGSWFFRGSIAP